MDLLNKRFTTKQVLRTDEMNQISVKIDEIIAYLNTQEGDNRYMVSTIVGDGSTNYLYFLQTEERAMLTASATTSVYSITAGTTHDYPEDYVAKVEIDKGSTGRYAVIASDVQVLRGQTLSLNIKGHLSTAQSRIRVTFTGTMSGASASWNGYAQLTTMSMSPANVGWHNPFIEGSTYGFGSFTITGSLQKTVHVNVTGDGYSRSYTDNIGTRTYSSNYYFTNMEFPSVSGVYDVEIYVESGILESAHYTYKIMCVSAADAQTKKLVCINEIGSKVTNASNSYIFAFAIYNGGATTGSPVRTITARYENTDHELSEETLSLATGIKHSLNYYLDITTGDNAPTITAKMTYGNEVSATLPVDNSASYPPTSGAVFRMNAATRTNSQANREDIVNDAGSTSYTATWTKVAFVDGMDGWTVDDNGRSCLAVNAGSKVDIAYSPLSSISSTLGKTIVLTYKVRNVSNYGEDIITIASIPQENPNRFVGLRIRPDEICLHSSIKNTEDSKQNYYIQDEDVVNASIVIAPNYRSPLEYGNFAQIYVNGAIKCEFSWDTSDSFTTNGHIILGSETADLYVYSIEVYNNAFSFSDAHVNYVASLPTTDDKADETEKNNAVINDSNEIDFSKVRTSANYFVIEMLDGKNVPNFSEWTKKEAGLSNLEMHYHEHHEWDWKVLNVETMGQGTTSMNYFRWNLRWRIDKSTNGGQKKYCYVQYDYNAEYDTWGSSTLSKTVMFDREHQVNGNLINVMRITAKKNYASSQQSHKMGTTSAYNDLRKAILGDNEAGGRTAVFQVPAYGFEKYKLEGSNNYEYRFIGLFTIGPDKGDKPTFAYNNGTYTDTLITMEGVDHDKRLAVFRYPWNSQVAFADESLCIDMGNGTYETGWEVGNCCGIDTEKKPQDALAKLVTEFKPAYEIAYKNSPFIMGLDPTQYTLEDINDDINEFGALRNNNDNYRPFNHYEFYFDGVYDLYFLNVATKKYELSGVNLLTDLGISASSLTGLTLAQKDARFRELRRTRFRNAMDSPNSPWNLRDCLFTHTFLTIWGATDNHAKNSYPYRFLDKFCWRQDDLDTIFDTDNQGHSTKKYSIEFKDWTDSNHSAYVFKGEDSAFWTLIEQCYQDELRVMGNSILTAMATLSPVTTGNTLDRLMGFFQSYYWDNAQDYFTKSAYNLDARYAYEEASLYFPDTYNPGVDPLEQSHGDSIEDEKRWVERRLIYAMSKYHYGPFVNYTDVSLGRIAFRSQLAQAFTLKPAMDLYPVIITGDNSAYFYGDADNGRTWDGTTCTMTNVGGSNTDVYIMAADYLRSIGDLCKLAVDSTTISGITISSKRLEVLKVGDIDPSKVTSNLKTLTLSNCPALLTIDARNLTNLTSSLNLVNCPRVREVYLGGTDVRTVNFAQGCKVTTYELSNSITALELKDLKFLTSVDTTACATKIQKINISGCDYLNSFQVMYEIWTTVGNVLQDIRITDVDIPNASDDVVEMLYKISAGLNSSGQATTYNGLDADGNVIQGHPYISGRIEVNRISTVYYNAITSYFQNLEIVGERESPSVDDIGLVFVGDTSTMMENATESRQFSVTANKQIYESVTWDGQFPNVEGAWLSSNGLLRFDSTDIAEARNRTTTRTIKITATSIYNSSAKVTEDILLQSVMVRSIELVATTQRLLTGGTAELRTTLNPSNNTKGKFLAFRSEDESVVTVSQRGVVTAVAQDFGVTNVLAYLTCDETTFTLLQFTVNDSTIIDSELQTEFATLMAYISSQGWSAESTKLYRSEAYKVTTLNAKLKGNTNLYDFNQFEYFTGVTTLSGTEFQNCTNLGGISFPTSLTRLERYVFQGCSSLTSLNFPSSLVMPDIGSLAYMTGLETLTVNGTITQNGTNGGYIFRGCTSLTSISVTKIILDTSNLQYTFSECTSLLSAPTIEITSNVTGLTYFFNKCSSLRTVVFDADSDFFGVTSINHMFESCTNLVSITRLRLTLRCTSTEYAFTGCNSIEDWDAVFSECDLSGVTNMYLMFYNCKSITRIPTKLAQSDKISSNGSAFQNCTSLVSADVSKWKVFGGSVFAGCTELTGNIDLRSATSIADMAFNQCRKVTNFILPDTPPTLSSTRGFGNTFGSFIVSSESVKSAYSSASNWSSYASRFVVDASYFE